jgi:hypothetical protein
MVATSLIACIAGVRVADAATTHITSPSSGSMLISSTQPGLASSNVVLSGTSDVVSGTLDIGCNAGGTVGAQIAQVATDAFGNFDTTMPASSFLSPGQGYCDLVAVGDWSDVVGGANVGPRVFVAQDAPTSGPTGTSDYFALLPAGGRGAFVFESLGHAGLDYSLSYDASDTAYSVFYGNGYLPADPAAGSPTPYATLRVDGRTAVTPYVAAQLSPGSASLLPLTYRVHPDPSGRASVITETDPILMCNTSQLPVSAGDNCTWFSASGVQVSRKMVVGAAHGAGYSGIAGQVAITDVWRSIDRRRHRVDLLSEEDYPSGGIGFSASWRGILSSPLPSVAAFLGVGPPGEAAIPRLAFPATYRVIGAPGAAASAANPVGIVTLAPAPTRMVWGTADNTFGLAQSFVIPPGRSITLTRIYDVAGSVGEARRIERVGRDAAIVPSVSAHVVGGAVTSFARVTVAGRVVDPAGIDVVSVAGRRITVGAGGRFRVSVRVHRGRNTLVAKVVDSAGNTSTATLRVVRR